MYLARIEIEIKKWYKSILIWLRSGAKNIKISNLAKKEYYIAYATVCRNYQKISKYFKNFNPISDKLYTKTKLFAQKIIIWLVDWLNLSVFFYFTAIFRKVEVDFKADLVWWGNKFIVILVLSFNNLHQLVNFLRQWEFFGMLLLFSLFFFEF